MNNEVKRIKGLVFRTYKNCKNKTRSILMSDKLSCVSPQVIVLGHQKSGTSAIAALLAAMSDKTLTNDIHRSHKNYKDYRNFHFLNELDSVFFSRYAFEMSREVVKEPEISFFYNSLKERFDKSKFVYVSRKPEYIIKSILSRLGAKVSSNQVYEHDFYDQLMSSPMWQDVLGFSSGCNIIEHLARRIETLDFQYYQNRDNFHLIKYEDFNKNKELAIEELSMELGFIKVNSIDNIKDKQYQPKSEYKSTDDYFSKDELDVIRTVCKTSKLIYG